MDLRSAVGDINRMRALAQELVGLQPDFIVTGGNLATAAVQREARTIPIVFGNVADPVACCLVPRLDRPSGNNLNNIGQSRTQRDIFFSKAYDFA
jgi:putative ABC transport system substrate-binding protein